MNPNSWLEKAERLRSTMAELRDGGWVSNLRSLDDSAALERAAIAHWLRQEFSEEPPEDTSTLPLFSQPIR